MPSPNWEREWKRLNRQYGEVAQALRATDGPTAFREIARRARAATSGSELFLIVECFDDFLHQHFDWMRDEIELELAANPGLRGALRCQVPLCDLIADLQAEWNYWTPPRSMRRGE